MSLTVSELNSELNFKFAAGEMLRNVSSVFCCDLLSLVISRANAGCAWVTVMGNVNAVAVALLADISCIVLAEGIQADAEMRRRADERGVAVLESVLPVFETAKIIDGLINR